MQYVASAGDDCYVRLWDVSEVMSRLESESSHAMLPMDKGALKPPKAAEDVMFYTPPAGIVSQTLTRRLDWAPHATQLLTSEGWKVGL